MQPDFRAHPLDGAMLYFDPATGTHVRVESAATRALVRNAPRAIMFGITNACNLRCDFCSRDVTRDSAWTVDSAATVLTDLADAGALEVAFGGGEPFAFRGFAELLRELRVRTRLAMHVTTNGTLITEARLAALSGSLGVVRLSIYDDMPWRPAARALFFAGQAWGANVLVHDRALAALPSLILELAALGARDLSILSYVGPDRSMMLSAAGEKTLAAIIRGSPLPCRLSVCFGARVDVPLLFERADCGAGLDFLSITPDKRVQSCSFQADSFPVESAEDALSVWRLRRDALRRASPRAGCARTELRVARPRLPGIRIWQSFSGNNSGECIMVAKFESAGDAERVLSDLIPGYEPGQSYSAPWKELFAREGVDSEHRSDMIAPDEMIAVGRSLIAHTVGAPGDDFPEIRAFSWKRGGSVIAGGVHVHHALTALGVVRARDGADAESIIATANASDAVIATSAHGLDVVVALSPKRPVKVDPKTEYKPLAAARDALQLIAGERPFAMELVFEEADEASLVSAMKRLGTAPNDRPRLLVTFWQCAQDDLMKEKARALAVEMDNATQVQNLVLVDNVVRKKRLAIRAHNANASVKSLDGETVEIFSQLWRPEPERTKGKKAPDPVPLDVQDVARDLRTRIRLELGPKTFVVEECAPETWGGRVRVRIQSSSPAEVLTAIASYADSNALKCSLGLADLNPLDRAIRRLLVDVEESLR